MASKKSTEPTEFSKLVNEELRVLMTRKGLNQTDLVKKSGVSQPVISRTIYNNSSVLNTNQLEALALAMGEDPSEILRRAELAIAHRASTSYLLQAQQDYVLAAKYVETGEGEDGVEYYEG